METFFIRVVRQEIDANGHATGRELDEKLFWSDANGLAAAMKQLAAYLSVKEETPSVIDNLDELDIERVFKVAELI